MIDKETEELLVGYIVVCGEEDPPSEDTDEDDPSVVYYRGWERGLLDAAAVVRRLCAKQRGEQDECET